MSYFNEYKWIIKTSKSLNVRKKCPGCKEKTNYINTEKFRVNANKNNIDIWLIYQCERCKHTWNMSIFERIKPKDIDRHMLERFMDNDKKLARKYELNLNKFLNSGIEVIKSNISYEVEKKVIKEEAENSQARVTIYSDCNLDIRIDKFLSDNLKISRSKIKAMIDNGEIVSEGIEKISKAKIKKELKLEFLKGQLLFESSPV